MFLEIDSTLIIILSLCGALVIILAILFFLFFKKKNAIPKIVIDEEFISNLINLYGDKDNISNIYTENGRLKIEVNDLNKVNLEKLKEISTNGVFVTGNTIKTLFRHDSDSIKKELGKRI